MCLFILLSQKFVLFNLMRLLEIEYVFLNILFPVRLLLITRTFDLRLMDTRHPILLR